MTVDEWLSAAETDARRRGLEDLTPLLRTLAKATAALRAAEWNQRAAGVHEDPPSRAGSE